MSFCKKCGNELPEGAKFCKVCGTPAAPAGNQMSAPANDQSGDASRSEKKPVSKDAPVPSKKAAKAPAPRKSGGKSGGAVAALIIALLLVLAIAAGAVSIFVFHKPEAVAKTFGLISEESADEEDEDSEEDDEDDEEDSEEDDEEDSEEDDEDDAEDEDEEEESEDEEDSEDEESDEDDEEAEETKPAKKGGKTSKETADKSTEAADAEVIDGDASEYLNNYVYIFDIDNWESVVEGRSREVTNIVDVEWDKDHMPKSYTLVFADGSEKSFANVKSYGVYTNKILKQGNDYYREEVYVTSIKLGGEEVFIDYIISGDEFRISYEESENAYAYYENYDNLP